jgi:hypothetical protein
MWLACRYGLKELGKQVCIAVRVKCFFHIPQLCRWLGFDRMGAEQFGDVLFGTDEWIGATG